LGEGEVDGGGVVGEVEGWELNGGDGDFWILWFEKCEVKG